MMLACSLDSNVYEGIIGSIITGVVALFSLWLTYLNQSHLRRDMLMREREMDRIAMIRTIAAKLVKLSFDYGYIKSSNLSQTNLNKCIKKLDKITNEFAKQTSLLRLCLYQSYYDRYEKKVLKAMDKVTDEYTNLNKGSKVKHLDEFIDAVRLYEMHKKVEEQ